MEGWPVLRVLFVVVGVAVWWVLAALSQPYLQAVVAAWDACCL